MSAGVLGRIDGAAGICVVCREVIRTPGGRGKPIVVDVAVADMGEERKQSDPA